MHKLWVKIWWERGRYLSICALCDRYLCTWVSMFCWSNEHNQTGGLYGCTYVLWLKQRNCNRMSVWWKATEVLIYAPSVMQRLYSRKRCINLHGCTYICRIVTPLNSSATCHAAFHACWEFNRTKNNFWKTTNRQVWRKSRITAINNKV